MSSFRARRLLPWLLLVVILILLGGSALVPTAPPPIVQPLAFNHKAHIAMGLECAACHADYLTQPFSGLPTLDTCLACHEEPVTSSPEEAKIHTAAAEGRGLPWKQIYRVPDHVYYSHRRHVVAGKLDCAACHGAIAETTSPPPHPLQDLSMEFCLSCHQQTGASEDCIACHK